MFLITLTLNKARQWLIDYQLIGINNYSIKSILTDNIEDEGRVM